MTVKKFLLWLLKVVLFTTLLIFLFWVVYLQNDLLEMMDSATELQSESAAYSSVHAMTIESTQTEEDDETETESETTDTVVPAETTQPQESEASVLSLPAFHPTATSESDPEDTIYSQSIMVHGTTVSEYTADDAHTIDFGLGSAYTQLEGIVTFRGNNFRNTAQYGLADIDTAQFGLCWTESTAGLNDIDGNYWGGSGWTGQPLVVQWPDETKQIMNMYDWAKEKEDLVEVIYATMGGYVYFLDLETGEATRDPLYLGYTFKGAGALDPRGYPLLYLGGGVVNANGENPRIMVVSLIDGQVLYTTGNGDDFAPRSWYAWDSSPLVDAETDQLIYPGEDGVLYIIDLNSEFDAEAGIISVDPEVVKFSYRSSTADQYYYGMEDSAIVWRNYLMIADNGGDYLCIDLNNLQIVWRFDCLDDTNCTAVLELDESAHPYVYLSTSFHYGWRSSDSVTVPVWKIDAETGEEVWHHNYTCYSESGLSGGSQGSLALGTGELDGILYVAMAREPDYSNGQLLALDTDTGEELWTYTSATYSWSTPTVFYDTTGKGYVLYTSSLDGIMYLFDGLTGDKLDEFNFDCTVEASPVVYNNTVVIGTRNQQIYGITLE